MTGAAISFWDQDPHRISRLLELREQRLSSRQIAMKIGCSRNTVIGKLARMKLPSLFIGPHSLKPQNRPQRPKPLHKPVPMLLPLKSRPVAVSTGSGLAIYELERNQCRWPISYDKEHKFCAVQTDGTSYCPEHAERMYVRK